MHTHDQGQYALACDQEASEHYGIEHAGIAGRIWRSRCYLNGFARALGDK